MPLDQPDSPLRHLDTDHIADDVAAELLRLAEVRQEAIFRAALSMDQRASVLAAGLVAAAGAVVVAGITVNDLPLRAAATVGAVLLAVAAGLCTFACRPQVFHFPGVQPLDWSKDGGIFLRNKLRDLRVSAAAELDEQMRQNEAQQAANGKLLRTGMLVAAVAPVISAFTFLAAKVP
jgi:hypothetical protein